MKKNSLLFIFLIASLFECYAQCINQNVYPVEPVESSNSGSLQQISDCSYEDTYANVTNLIIGSDYIFSCVNYSGTHKYITLTDFNNNVLVSGLSPLTIEAVTVTTLRAHYSENAACSELLECNISSIQALLSCPPPINILITNVTTNSASFGWTLGDTENSWEVLVLADGSTPPDASTSGNTVLFNPYSISTLSTGTAYQFYIRANCGDEFSPWAGPFDFSTECLPISLFNEDFNSTPDGELPNCWTEIVQTPISPATSSVAASFGEVIMSNFDADGTVILASPKLTNLGNGTHRLKFKARGDSDNQTLQVGTLNAVYDDAIFTPLQEITVNSLYSEFTVDFASYLGTNTYIGIKNNSGQFFSIYLDNIRWEVSPLCPDVTSIVVTNTTTDSAAISWTAGGSQTAWDIVFSEIDITDPTTLTPISPSPSGTPQSTLTGLLDNTNYNVWIRTVCGEPNGNGDWIGPIQFKTQCFATDSFDENFDSTVGTGLPDCWSSVVNGDTVDALSAYVQGSDFTFNSPSRSVELTNGSSSSSDNVILVSPQLNNLSGGTHRLKLFATAYQSSSIQVGTLTSNTNTAIFTPLQTIAINTNYIEYVIDFTGYTGADTYIGIRHNSSNAFSSIFVDDVKWELAPLCGDVQNITLTEATPSSLTINWNASSTTETQWNIVYGDENETDPNSLTPLPITATPEAVLTGLLENTTYTIWVRSVCGEPNGNGNWIGPYSYRTPCNAIATFTENFDSTNEGELPSCWSKVLVGNTVSNFANVSVVTFISNSLDKSVEISNDSSESSDFVMLVSPNLSTLSSGLHRLKFYGRTTFGSGSVEVGTMDFSIPNGTFSSFQTVNLTDSFTEFIIDFAAYTGTDTYIAIRNTSDSFNSVYIDDIVWELSPLCPDVANIGVSGITSNQANVSWTAGGSEPNWQVAYGLSTVTDPTTLTPSPILDETNFNLSDLIENTEYNVWVRSVCGEPNGNGNWIGPLNFRTNCLPVTSFNEDFDATTTLPDCWNTLINGEGVSPFAYVQVNEFTSNSGTNSIELYNYDAESTANIVLVLPQVSNLNSGDNILKFYARSNDPASVQVGTLDSTSSSGIFTNFQTISITDTFEEYEVDFSSYVGTDIFLGIRHNSESTFNSIFIDDVSWEENLSITDSNIIEFNYYPNPVKNDLYLKSNLQLTHIEIYSLLGQKLIDKSIDGELPVIDMSKLMSGYYIIKVQTLDGFTKTIKVVKE